MKKKVFLVICCFIVLGLLTGCNNSTSNVNNGSESNSNSNSNSNVTNGGNNNENEMANTQAKYASSLLEEYKDLKKVNGNIKDIEINGNNLIITNDNKIYKMSGDYLATIDNIQEIIDYGGDPGSTNTLFKTTDGKYILYSSYNKNIVYTIDLDNVIYAYSGAVFTLENGYLYYYNDDSKGNFTNKERLYLDLDVSFSGWEDEIYDGKVEVFGSSGTGDIYFKLSNNRIMGFNMSVMSDTECDDEGENCIERYITNTSIKQRNFSTNVDKEVSHMYGFSGGLGYPIYSIKGNEKVIYLMESYDNTMTITFKENYTTDMVDKVYYSGNSNDVILVEMKDKSIYSFKDDTLSYSEELSKLNQENHIKKWTYDFMNLCILCDDGYVYEINEYAL